MEPASATSEATISVGSDRDAVMIVLLRPVTALPPAASAAGAARCGDRRAGTMPASVRKLTRYRPTPPACGIVIEKGDSSPALSCGKSSTERPLIRNVPCLSKANATATSPSDRRRVGRVPHEPRDDERVTLALMAQRDELQRPRRGFGGPRRRRRRAVPDVYSRQRQTHYQHADGGDASHRGPLFLSSTADYRTWARHRRSIVSVSNAFHADGRSRQPERYLAAAPVWNERAGRPASSRENRSRPVPPARARRREFGD